MKTNIFKEAITAVKISMILLLPFSSFSQTWDFDFGTGTGEWITASGYNNSLLPQPISGAGASQLSIGAVAQGSGFYLQNSGLPLLGSESELKSTASTGVAVNKFSIFGYVPSKVFYTKMSILFGDQNGASGPKSGYWYFYQGSGSLYSNMSNASTNVDQSFVSLRFAFSNGGIIQLAYHNGISWIDVTSLLPFVFEQGKIYTLEIYANNSNVLTDYYNNTLYKLGADKWDLWINGTPILKDLKSGGIANNVNIDSWLFAGEQSTTNFATIFIDNMSYSNGLPGSTLPISLVSFDGKSSEKGVELSWLTASELNNDFFTVESSSDGWNFSQITEIKGAGTSNKMINYEFTDYGASDGIVYYRLKQTDFDGNYSYSQVISVNHNAVVLEFSIENVFAGNDFIYAGIKGKSGKYHVEIFSITGSLIYNSDIYTGSNNERIQMPFNLSERGIYFLTITGDTKSETTKFVF